jgi:glutathione S-transferase
MYRLHGVLGSPYSMKMRALLRYRRIPHIWVQDFSERQALFGRVKAPVIPLLEYPDGRVANDSTLLTRDLEARHPERGVIPPDPATAFLAFLIEDFADEWVTKAMFAYRWLRPEDQAQMARWLMFDSMPGQGSARQEAMAQQFRDRQVGRMALVGCTAENDPLIVASTRRLLDILDDHVSDGMFLFGSRPSEAEFALFGQLSQLGTDPTAQAMMRRDFPLAYRWLGHVDDLSGLEGEWDGAGAMVGPIIHLIGDVYLPFLAGNARAVANNAESFAFEALGYSYSQPPFRYQAKCLLALRTDYAALDRDARAKIAPLLLESGGLAYLEGRD